MQVSRIGRIAAGAVLVAGGLVAIPTAAFAASAPSCVSFYQTGSVLWHTAHVHNGCSTTQRMRIILSLHTDGPCETWAPGDSGTYGYPGTANLQGMDLC